MSDVLYNPQVVEPKWQQFWEEQRLFQQSEAQEGVTPENKKYMLFAFAYPSGSGLHVGHVESKTALDIISRYYRMHGQKVFFPVGWDAFGLPAENYAIKTGIPPAKTTHDAITTFRRQIKRLGISYDWENELATNHPEYYRWTQWIFLQLFNKGLAYRKDGMVNWCPSCQTVLANEQVVEGACERCGSEVVQKELEQWYLKITDYADELISGLDEVDWPRATKLQQLNWIGKSQGVTYNQRVKDLGIHLEAYDSVPQTFMAQSFCVIAPEHPLLEKLVEGTEQQSAVMDFVEEFKRRKVQNRFQIDKEVEGIFTGRYIENPFGTGDLPIWVATFVIADYGSGFVNCSAHDERDFAFAKKYNIQLRPVMFPVDEKEAERVKNLEYPYHHQEDGVLTLPVELAGRKWGESRQDVIAYIEQKGFGKATTQYKLRDWLISRQRYWGAPIPIVYDQEGTAHPVKDEHLPWMLPTDVEFKPTGESPLKNSKEFIERTEKLYGKGWRPEFDTMDTFVDSSWYYLRYVSARNSGAFVDGEQADRWLPVDLYMIGPEHIVLHLLYSRFFTKFLRDEGYLKFDEPFMKMRHQGMILGPDGRKMSKSKGNVINPDDIVEKFGADTLRVYEMFMGPLEADKAWDTRAVIGVHKFLQRMYRLVQETMAKAGQHPAKSESVHPVVRKLHQTLRQVSEQIPQLKFNTSIAALMELANTWEKSKADNALSKDDVHAFVCLIAPFAPFLAEELHQQFWPGQSVHLGTWPSWNEDLAQEEELTIAVQVNGKLRAELSIPQALSGDKPEVLKRAKQLERITAWIKDKEIRKEIYVPGKIVNFVM